MILYKCINENCSHVGETEICSSCGSTTKRLSQIYWCDEHNVPMFAETCESSNKIGKIIGSDIRPVFPDERLLLEIIIGKPLKYLNSSVWNIKGGRYIVDGEIVFFNMKLLDKLDSNFVISELNKYKKENKNNSFDKYKKVFIKENKSRFKEIDEEAIKYILINLGMDNDNLDEFGYRRNLKRFVSFSGGKDSTVTASLVRRATNDASIFHLYGDTTLEFPETEQYVARFRKNNPKTPLVISKNKEKDFYELCKQIGPPSRVMRWCCTIFKTGAITNKINTMFKSEKSVISFHGIRRSESFSRSKYERTSENSKIAKQITLCPIIDWTDFDVWLYILTMDIDFNDAYRYGYTRVGCWCCPNNSGWSTFLSKIYMPEQYNRFRNMLVDFAKEARKPDPEVYVDEGGWKARQGGNGVQYSKTGAVSFTPCALEKNTYNYVLNKPITQELYELFKPFGILNFSMGKERLGEVYVLNLAGTPIMRLSGKIGTNELKVSLLKLPIGGVKNFNAAEGKVKCQIVKYQMCVSCSGCISACKHDAISIKERNGKIEYKIDEKKCIHCFECINHYTGGCYMKHVLAIKGD